MITLAICTNNPDAELHILRYEEVIASRQWRAHRQLSDTLHRELIQLLAKASLNVDDITGVVVHQGPGSFTGLRIGFAAANALAYSLHVPIVGASGDDWVADGLERLSTGEPGNCVQPIYGADPHTTKPRK